MSINVVIGAGFGDEGKGLMTDYFASQAKNNYGSGLVVRFNGGSQAAHTVVTPEGKRHVFGHFGSGTLVGLPTYLSSFFAVHPILFREELAKLKVLGLTPKVYVDKECIVTTPFDMLINQIAETVRGENRHGSVGFGVNETVTRSENFLKITVADLLPGREKMLALKLETIEDLYVSYRLEELGIKEVPPYFAKTLSLNSANIVSHYLADAKAMMGVIEIADSSMLHNFESVIFEGAQGLLLDQNHKYFPYVTHSNTGVKNVRKILESANLSHKPITVTYVTRCYATRHGAGPFPHETDSPPFAKIEDLTNVPNIYQGALRFGLLDLDILAESIHADLAWIRDLNCVTKIAITCLDQVDEDKIKFILGEEEVESTTEEFITVALPKGGYLSYGPTRSTIKHVVNYNGIRDIG